MVIPKLISSNSGSSSSSKHSKGKQHQPSRSKDEDEVEEDLPLIVPIKSFMQFNQANNPIHRYGGTYISSCSSEFSSANLTSKNTVTMEYSVSSNSLTSSGFNSSGFLGQNKLLRENFENSINFLNIPEEEDDDDNSLVVLTEKNDDIPISLQQKQLSPPVVFDVINHVSASSSVNEINDDSDSYAKPSRTIHPSTNQTTAHDDSSSFTDDEIEYWRPIEEVVLRKYPEVAELLFDLDDLWSHTPILLNEEYNDEKEQSKSSNDVYSPPSTKFEKPKLSNRRQDTSKSVRSRTRRKNNAIPPLHPSSRIFSMQKNQYIVEEYDYTQNVLDSNPHNKSMADDRYFKAVSIQRLYRGWKCRLTLMQKVSYEIRSFSYLFVYSYI